MLRTVGCSRFVVFHKFVGFRQPLNKYLRQTETVGVGLQLFIFQHKKGGNLSDKPYGIGSVGFPTQKLPVAEEAVSFSFRVHDVTARATESPLSPYYNLR